MTNHHIAIKQCYNLSDQNIKSCEIIKNDCEQTPLYDSTIITIQNPNLKFPGNSQIVGAPLIRPQTKINYSTQFYECTLKCIVGLTLEAFVYSIPNFVQIQKCILYTNDTRRFNKCLLSMLYHNQWMSIKRLKRECQ